MCGAHKVCCQLNRDGYSVGRDRVARLMTELELAGVRHGKANRTTVPGDLAARPGDFVDSPFWAKAPNLTYGATWSGFCYAACVTDVFSRRIGGWRVSNSLRSDLALDVLEMAIWSREGKDLGGLVHH